MSKKTQTQTDVALAPRTQAKEPSKYLVVLHNDDYTTMEFVIEVLRMVFHKTPEEAAHIMMKVHEEGKGVAGVYSFEVAETKAEQATRMAREAGFPLKLTLEKA